MNTYTPTSRFNVFLQKHRRFHARNPAAGGSGRKKLNVIQPNSSTYRIYSLSTVLTSVTLVYSKKGSQDVRNHAAGETKIITLLIL